MTDKPIALLPNLVRPLLQSRLPDWLETRWFSGKDEALAQGPGAEIAWLDMASKADMAAAITHARDVRWLNSVYAGVDGIPLDLLQERGTRLTNGAGLNAITIAEYVLMGMLTIAKGYREVVHAQQRREWLNVSPGKVELLGSRALVLGYGAIGQGVHERLTAFGVAVTVVRRSADAAKAELGPDQWRARLGVFDCIILALPATAQTQHLIGAAELAAMKPGAVLLNVARGSIVDTDALVAALQSKHLGAAFLDVTEPEPLPAEHILWSLDNAHISMHLSGRSQTHMFARAADRFVDNLARYRAGQALQYGVDLTLGY